MRQQAENALFDAELSKEIERQLDAKRSGKTLVEKMGAAPQIKKAQRFKIDGDDENQTLMWRSLMKDCAFYYDAPTIKEEMSMQKTL